MGAAVQIWRFARPLLHRLDIHMGCQIEDSQQERAQLTTEGDLRDLVICDFWPSSFTGFKGLQYTVFSTI